MRIVIISIAILFFVSGCCQKKYSELSPSDLSWLPYHKADTLYFKSNLGDIEKWIVKEESMNESADGGVGSRCVTKWYSSPSYTIDNLTDSSSVDLSIVKSSDRPIKVSIYFFLKATNSDSNSFNTSPDLTLGYRVEMKVSTDSSDLRKVVFQKGIGIKSYSSKDGTIIYEKI